jgi:hypothetical protein
MCEKIKSKLYDMHLYNVTCLADRTGLINHLKIPKKMPELNSGQH